jgi:hypothetical protein
MQATTNAAVNAASAAETARSNAEREPMKFARRIGSTTYMVNAYFSQTATETMQDKVLRIVGREAQDGG